MKIAKTLLSAAAAIAISVAAIAADKPSELNDLEIAHAAYTADNIDIRYAHLALAISKNPAVREFAETMIRDHNAVNEQALALLRKLGAEPQDNFLSQSLEENADKIVDELSKLRGAAFDKRYAQNDLDYHKAVVGIVENDFIPNIENAEVKALFEAGLVIFKQHTNHAQMMVDSLK